MGIKTKIEFADSTVNPVMGCTGCELYHKEPDLNHCYAARLINRFAGKPGWPKSFNEPEYFLERMEKALDWSDLTGKKREDEPWLNSYPRIIFVNDLSDGFCPDVDPKTWLLPFMKRMAESPHIWLLLTKWPQRMIPFFRKHSPPQNFWLGVSVLTQLSAWRAWDLLTIPAAIQFVSFEPLLGPVYLGRHDIGFDWIVVGGESGPNARPMHPAWPRIIRDECIVGGIPFLFKQWGAWIPFGQGKGMEIPKRARGCWLDVRGQSNPTYSAMMHNPAALFHVGKEIAGRKLDGELWEEMPNANRS